jgi:hypothetical protein
VIHTDIQEKFGLPPDVRAAVERDFAKKIPLARFGGAPEVRHRSALPRVAGRVVISGLELEFDGVLSAVA